jgi:hypothetical protein
MRHVGGTTRLPAQRISVLSIERRDNRTVHVLDPQNELGAAIDKSEYRSGGLRFALHRRMQARFIIRRPQIGALPEGITGI